MDQRGPEAASQVSKRSRRERHEKEGDVAHLLEPDLKQAKGGLRDLRVLHALGLAAPLTGPLEVTQAAADLLLTVRVELHRVAGRATDRLLLQYQDDVAGSTRPRGCRRADGRRRGRRPLGGLGRRRRLGARELLARGPEGARRRWRPRGRARSGAARRRARPARRRGPGRRLVDPARGRGRGRRGVRFRRGALERLALAAAPGRPVVR